MEISETASGDDLSTRLDGMIRALPPFSPTIRRADYDVYYKEKILYEPKLLSIGPLHHGKDYLQNLEHKKLEYLKLLVQRRNESSVDKFVSVLRQLEEKARGYYCHLECSSDEFIQILLLDGIFIIEYLRKHYSPGLIDENDLLFQPEISSHLKYDLMLVENQVPFCVLNALFAVTKDETEDASILELIKHFFPSVSPWSEYNGEKGLEDVEDVDHLLGVVHKIWCSSFLTKEEQGKVNDRMKMVARMSVFELKDKMMVVAVRSISELKRAGIKFLKNTETRNGLNLRFLDGVMIIPSISISSGTARILYNLIAYEQFVTDEEHCRYVTDYVFFLHRLLSCSNDVKILRSCGILTHLLPTDHKVSKMFKNLCRNILVSPDDFCYADVCHEVNQYCRRSQKVSLRHCCFNAA